MPTNPERLTMATMDDFSSLARLTIWPRESSITKFGWVIWSWLRKIPTLPTKMPLTPLLSCACQNLTMKSRPKKVTLRKPVPSVRTTSRRSRPFL